MNLINNVEFKKIGIKRLVEDDYLFYFFWSKYDNFVVNPKEDDFIKNKNIENVIFININKYDVDLIERVGYDKNILIVDPLDKFYLNKTIKWDKKYELILPSAKLTFSENLKNDYGEFLTFTRLKEKNLKTRPIIICLDPISNLDDSALDLIATFSAEFNFIYGGKKVISNERELNILRRLMGTRNVTITSFPVLEYEFFDLLNSCDFIFTNNKNIDGRQFPVMSVFAILNNKIPLVNSPNRFYSWLDTDFYVNIDKIRSSQDGVVRFYESMFFLLQNNTYKNDAFNSTVNKILKRWSEDEPSK